MSVNYVSVNSTAVQPSDYSARTGTVSFPAGAVSAAVAVPIRGDTTDEANETFRVNLSSPFGATIVDGAGIGTVFDDDPSSGDLRVMAGDVTIYEGDAGIRTAYLTVSLSRTATSTVTVDYRTADGTATQPGDYMARSGTLTFTAGATNRSVALPIKADTVVEVQENLTLRLSNATGGARMADGTGVVTIRDDD